MSEPVIKMELEIDNSSKFTQGNVETEIFLSS